MVSEGKFIVASGPVIVEDGKLLVTKDDKDDFYKLPGGTVKEGESLEDACKREAKNEVNAEIEIIKPLMPNILYKNPQTGEKMTIVLINYLSKLKNKDELKLGSNNVDMKWVELSVAKSGGENVSPNVQKLVEKEWGNLK